MDASHLRLSVWGLWRTTTLTAGKAMPFADPPGEPALAAAVHNQIGPLLSALQASPKSRGWKLPARVGERKRWYELPEEAHSLRRSHRLGLR